jgi:3-hydroxybutyryl-CoA dehydrogenase
MPMSTNAPPPHAAIIGGGIMGCDIAAIFAAGGWQVHVVSPTPATRDSLPARLTKALGALQAEPALASHVQTHARLEDVPWPQVAIVIEAATEELALKQQLFSQLEALARPDIPLATNTSSFQISEVGQHLRTRSRVIGLHFFMPAHLVPAVEVVCAEFSDAAVADTAQAIMQTLGKMPLRVAKDIPGFVANRLQHALVREALWMVANGVASPEAVDTAVRYGFGFRFLACGPMLQKEMSGWDTNYRSGSMIYPSLCKDDRPPDMFRDMVARGETGMKAGRGLWQWDAAAIQREKSRYEKTLQAGFEILTRKDE